MSNEQKLPAGVPELDPLPLVIVSADRPAWTDDQLRDIYALGARRGYEAGLEAAADVVESMTAWTGGHGEPSTPSGSSISTAIRQLKGKQ